MKKENDIDKRNMTKIIILLIFLTAGILSLYYRSEKIAVQSSKEHALKTVADFKIDQISSWYVDEMVDIDLISKDETLSELIGFYIATGGELEKKHLIRYINRIKTEHLYSDILLLKKDGELLVSTQSQSIPTDSIVVQFLKEAVEQKVSLNSDFFKSTNGKVYIDFIASVTDIQNRNMVGLICRKDPDVFLNPLLKNWPTTKKTAETYLVKKALNGKHYTYRPNLNNQNELSCWRIMSEKDELSNLAADDKMGVFYGVNEDNVKICSYISPIPQTPWKIIVRANKSELFKELYANMLKVVFISILLILICVGVLSIINRKRREAYLRELLAKETDLQQYQERFNGTIDILSEGVCLVKAEDQTFVLTNLKMDEMFGYERGELIGQNLSILLASTEKSKKDLISENSKYLKENKMLDSEFFNIRKDGTTFWTTIRVNLMSHDKFGPVWIGVVHDITDQKKYEAKLLQSEASYKTLFENNPHPMWVYDIHSLKFLSVNKTAVDKYGYSLEEFLNMTLYDILPPEDFDIFNYHFETKADFQHNRICRHKLKNGEIIHVEIASHTISYFSHNARLTLANDITKTMKYESELIAAKEKAEDSERLKTAFLANMSHEIRTPLNGIIGFSQLLNEENLGKEDIKSYSGFIVDGGTRLLALLSNILNISKIESGTESLYVSHFTVNDTMRSIFNQFLLESKERMIDYQINLPEVSEDVRLITDVVKLRQILTNFLSNSFKFTKFGSIELGYSINEIEIVFFVKDSGIGIDAQIKERIFERFYQADDSFSNGHEGAGLGLAICRGFSTLMKGNIRIDSELGKGSTFYLTLPLKLEIK